MYWFIKEKKNIQKQTEKWKFYFHDNDEWVFAQSQIATHGNDKIIKLFMSLWDTTQYDWHTDIFRN